MIIIGIVIIDEAWLRERSSLSVCLRLNVIRNIVSRVSRFIDVSYTLSRESRYRPRSCWTAGWYYSCEHVYRHRTGVPRRILRAGRRGIEDLLCRRKQRQRRTRRRTFFRWKLLEILRHDNSNGILAFISVWKPIRYATRDLVFSF